MSGCLELTVIIKEKRLSTG